MDGNKILSLLVFCLLLFLLFSETKAGGWWRRGRRGCDRVNCVWGVWSQWTSCSHPCGNAGTQDRSRGIARHPSCGGAGCSGPNSERKGCNRFCHNGGNPQPGYCSCQDRFWGTCCKYREYISLFSVPHVYCKIGRKKSRF